MSSLSLISTYKTFPVDNKQGGQGGNGSFYLQSGTTDIILANDDKLLIDTGDLLLLSSGTCQDLMLISGGTDNFLLSGTTDVLLIGGYCTSAYNDSSMGLRISG